MDDFDPKAAAAARAACIVRQPVLAVEVKVTLEGITPPHWRRLVLPAAWSLRASAEAICLSFDRWVDVEVAFFEVTGSSPSSVARYFCGTDNSRAAGQRSASLNDILTPDLTRVTYIQGAGPPGWPNGPRKNAKPEAIDPAWFTTAEFTRTAWSWDVHVESLHMESGDEPIPRTNAASGCFIDGWTSTLDEFRDQMRRWRAAGDPNVPPPTGLEAQFRAECGDPDRADLSEIDFLIQSYAAPIWRRMKRLSM